MWPRGRVNWELFFQENKSWISLPNLINCNFVKKRLQETCFPLNNGEFMRAPILKNICEWLHLKEFNLWFLSSVRILEKRPLYVKYYVKWSVMALLLGLILFCFVFLKLAYFFSFVQVLAQVLCWSYKNLWQIMARYWEY